MSYYVHETSIVDENVSIGDGTRVWHFCHLMKGARLGKNCSLGQNVCVGNNVVLGNGVKVQCNVQFCEGNVLEDYVFVGPSVVFTNDTTPRAKYPKGVAGYKPTLIKEGASLGGNANIVCGHTVGRWAMIAAGAVVTKDVPDHALMMGVPAERKGWVCECGQILDDGLICHECGRSYREEASGLVEIQL